MTGKPLGTCRPAAKVRPPTSDSSRLQLRVAELCVLVVALGGASQQAFGQSHRERVIGQVVTARAAPVAGATVTLTRAPDRAMFTQVTDRSGKFDILVDSGTGDYLLHVSVDVALGLAPVLQRVRRLGSGDTLLAVTVVLRSRPPQALPTATVKADRPVPEPTIDLLTPGTGAVERPVFGVTASSAPDQRGNFGAIAATVPGITPTANGFVTLGSASSQNSVTMNGMSFPGASLPRDARFTTRVSTSTFDPSRGWFGGAETSVDVSPGGLFHTLNGSLTVDDPRLQWGDRSSKATGQANANLIASLGGDGYALGDRMAYSFGLEASERRTTVSPFQLADSVALARVGIAAGVAAATLRALAAAGIPQSRPGASLNGSVVSTGSLVARLNTPEFDVQRNQPAQQSVGLIVYAFHQEQDGVGAAVQRLPSRQDRSTFDIGTLQLVYRTLTARRVHESIRSAVSVTSQRFAPYVEAPAGNLLLSPSLGNEGGAGAAIFFGGAGERVSNLLWTWETQSRTTFYAPGATRHLLELSADARWDAQRRDDLSNRNGTFDFPSLDAFVQNRPSSFSRTIAATPETGGSWNGFIGIGDTWRASPSLRFLLGLRVEGNAYVDHPARNPAVETAFAQRNDFVPNTVGVSPRAGFSWHYSSQPATSGYIVTGLGTLPYFATGVIRGGVGEFRSILLPGLLGAASGLTGLPGGRSQFVCTGSAAPVPDWSAYINAPESVPLACAGAATSLQDVAPSVQLIDRTFTAPRSWRANLGWAARNSWMSWSTDLTLALNRNQTGWVDLNFADTPKFFTSDEHRPIFVSPEGIVPATGVVSTAESHRASHFGQVTQLRSDLNGTAAQFTTTIVPDLLQLTGQFYTAASYTLGRAWSEQRGFAGTTFESPNVLTIARAPYDVRHTILLQAGIMWPQVSLTVYARIASGVPYTPVIGSDVNGDGLANDRAFVFDPASVRDTTLASGLRQLLRSAPMPARACLQRLVGRSAGTNSCEGPWTATINATVTAKKLEWHDLTVSVALVNLPALFDQLFHGDRLQGWGSAPTPDSVLYFVRSFDSSAQAFRYAVNPRFGSTTAFGVGQLAPFKLTVDVRMSLASSSAVQQANRLLRPGRASSGAKLSVAETLAKLRVAGPAPYHAIIELADSLLLREDQARELEATDASYTVRADSVWRRLAEWMTSLPSDFDQAEVVTRQREAADAVWELARKDLQANLPRILSPIQLTMLPWPASFLWGARKPISGMGFVINPTPQG